MSVTRRMGYEAVELAALSGPEWPQLLAFIDTASPLPFGFISVHGPTKDTTITESQLVDEYQRLPRWVDVIVVHPDIVDNWRLYLSVGPRLSFENLDPRKRSGRTAEELEWLFADLQEARLCLDVAHAAAVDPAMAEAHALLDRFGHRLSHVHISSLGIKDRHKPLTQSDAERFAPVLQRCAHVPWIFEA